MELNYNNKKIHYVVNSKFEKGENEKPILVFLHGWGGNNKSFSMAYQYFSNIYPIISLDFWGFGESDAPNIDYCLNDYVMQVKVLLKHLKAKNIVLIGHSFGGRVAIKLANDTDLIISKLILVDSAGIKPRFSLIKFFKVKNYKIKKFLVKHKFLNANCLTNAGSMDYKLMREEEKGVFIRIVNEYLNDVVKKINIPTLILWGANDKETPPYMAKILNRLITNSKLVVLDGGHYAYLENHLQFCNEINNFIGE